MEENKLIENFELFNKMCEKANNANMYSPAQLAYAGDAVFELLVRNYVLNNYDTSVNQMHRLTVKFVRAKAQAYIVSQLTDELSEEEKKIVKRGRNAKVTSSPKNVEFMDYRYATGFEALFGYLFLNKNIDRLLYIFHKAIEVIAEKDDKIENNRRKKSGD
ncbi:MAG TPA: ribonuclease III domain-containing protein [Sedimentibacter sp.]|nr:ribonuclease III domain-containing protein [Sedimentibacter sp.]HOW23175.1 ribonuclease III domain-containing protein [Sedimentibacter sp.]HRC79836.1 ribonuclease III domain-containing protein [Sedimentibacter sp.]